MRPNAASHREGMPALTWKFIALLPLIFAVAIFFGLSSWSLYGTKTAFGSYRGGNWEIYLMNADGSSQTRPTTSPRTGRHPGRRPHLRTKSFPRPNTAAADINADILLDFNADFIVGRR